MTTNGYAQNPADKMNTADLTVGDKLVQVHSYGYGSTYNFTDWTVTKILKTRLVITSNSGTERRMIVEYSKQWPYRNGDVTTRIEGDYLRYSGTTLYTADDPALDRLRNINEFKSIVRTANEAAEKATSKSMSVQDAQATIDALQAFITASKEN